MNRLLLIIFFSLIQLSLFAQFGNISKKLKEKAGEVVKDKLIEKTDEKRDEYDTTSFNYAIAFLDKSESFANKQKGEDIIKATNFLLKKDQSKSDEEKARNLYEFGRLNYLKRSYKLAEYYLIAAKVAFELLGKESDPIYLKTNGLLGLLYADMGRFEGAEAFTTTALDGWENELGDNSSGYIAEFNNLAVLKLRKGNFNQAEKDLKQTLIKVENTEGKKSVPYAITQNNLAILYVSMGRLDEASKLINSAVDVAEDQLVDKSGTVLQLMTNKALVYQEQGNYEEAEKTYKKALDMQTSRLKINAKSDPDYAHMLNNLASLYAITNRMEEAEELLNESLEIYRDRFGDDHPLTASAEADLGNLNRYQGKLEKAEELLEKSLNKRKNLLGEDHPETAQNIEDLAIVKWKLKKIVEAQTLFHQSLDYSLEFINEFFPPLSEVEKTQYWNQLKPRFHSYYNFVFDVNEPELLKKAFKYRAATKGLLLNSSTKIKNTILNSDNKELVSLYTQWIDQKRVLASYYSLSKEEITDQKINLDSIESAANDSERKLSELSSDFTSEFISTKTGSNDITQKLNPEEALVEIIQFPVFENQLTKTIGYAAMVVKAGSSAPKLVLIDTENKLDKKGYSAYKNLIRLRQPDNISYKLFWTPIEKELAGINKVYISPDGVYNQVNLNTLRNNENQFLIAHKAINIIGNPTDLLEVETSKSGKNSAFLVGFPDYSSPGITPLPGTQKEVNEINQFLSGSNYSVDLKTRNEASEFSVKKVKNPKILHIATHGFFLEDLKTDKKAFGVDINYLSDNPLLRSGLMLADAENDANTSFDSSNDGVLTSYEAINLDLNTTNLVVLSACETGKGDIQAGEGVYGLQRAFSIAGADKLIMSLWKVDDEATQKLMSSFYKNWVRNNQPLDEAFRNAQLELMNSYDHPYYWGAFVMIN